MPYKDKQKGKEYKKAWNRRFYSSHKPQEIIRTGERKAEMRKWFKEYKRTLNCSKCGENNPACLEFHHSNKNSKEFEISESFEKMGYSKDRIMDEISKCVVLCANCHRKLHSREIPADIGSNPVGATI